MPAIAHPDGDLGLGQVVARRGIAIAKAQGRIQAPAAEVGVAA
jgi:hypothetical protein